MGAETKRPAPEFCKGGRKGRLCCQELCCEELGLSALPGFTLKLFERASRYSKSVGTGRQR